MKIFIDTEFTGLHKNTTLISIGIKSECGKTFYMELNDYDESQVDDWIRKNVIDNLLFGPPPEGQQEHYSASRSLDNPVGKDLYKGYSLEARGNKADLKKNLKEWLSQFGKIEVWSDCLSYDWVLFNDIFGHAFNIPENIYYIPFDICTMFKLKGIDPDISREEYAYGDKIPTDAKKHNALWDAEVIKACHDKLLSENIGEIL